jgi:fructosamine-3-kinase
LHDNNSYDGNLALLSAASRLMLVGMSSPTQRQLTTGDVAAAADRAFGIGIAEAAELSGGSFGSVWKARLADDRWVVLKSAPTKGAGLLTYEADMIGEEANYLRLAAPVEGAPTAELLYVDDEFLFMTPLPGGPLCDIPDHVDRTVPREESGAAIAHLHSVTGDFFGYAGDRPHAANWPDAFAAMMDAILDDAVAWGVPLPVPAESVRDAIASHRDLLAAVTTPVLLHFDLWDGNVMVHDGHLSGLVDGERYLFGDPIVDFVSPTLFRGHFDHGFDHPFARGYAQVRPFEINDGVRNRLRLYQVYLYLLMIVEYPSRGMTPVGERWEQLNDTVRVLMAALVG